MTGRLPVGHPSRYAVIWHEDALRISDIDWSVSKDLAANVSPASMATIKHQINAAADQDAISATLFSNDLMRASLGQPDSMEGITSFLEKRPPSFAPFGSGTRFAWMDDRAELPPA